MLVVFIDLSTPLPPPSWDDFHKELGNNKLTHSQIISRTLKPTSSWVYQSVQPSQHQVGFIRPQAYKPNTARFIRLFTAKPTISLGTNQSNIWIYQATNRAIIQAGFIRQSNRELLTSPNTTRPSQAILQVGFIGILRQWKGRMLSQGTLIQS